MTRSLRLVALALLLAAPALAGDLEGKGPIAPVVPGVSPISAVPAVPALDTRLAAPLSLPNAALPGSAIANAALPGAAAAPLAAAPASAIPSAQAAVVPNALAQRALAAQAAGAGAAGGSQAAPGQLNLKTGAAIQVNSAAEGAAASGKEGGTSDSAREDAGAAFDLSKRGLPAGTMRAAPVTAAQLSGRGRSGLTLAKPSDGERLARLAAETAQLRAVRAEKGEGALSAQDASVLRGIDDLAAAAALGKSTPAQLARAARTVENIELSKLRKFSALAAKFIDTDVQGKSSPFARVGNVEHVNQQLIDPLTDDGAALAEAFKTAPGQTSEHFVEMIKALQYATDTGKQQNPDDMAAALARFNSQVDTGPNWYVNNFILPHEYASMKWAQTLGREAGLSAREIEAFQRLIANHNFGPDLADPKNAVMREHWWPKNFREQMLPMLAAMGVDTGKLFSRDEHGALQYNSAQGHHYALLLAAYDRAIAVKANGYGLATWKKYGTQDFNGKKGRLKGIREANGKKGAAEALTPDPDGAKDESGKPGEVFEFDGPAVIRAMEATADWAEQHVESLWASLYAALPANSPARARYPTAQSFRMYPPFYAQRKSIGTLNGLLRVIKASNPEGMTNRADVVPRAGVAYYEARSKGLAGVYRITLERVGPGARNPRSTDYRYEARLEVSGKNGWETPRGPGFGAGALAVAGDDPVALYLDLIRRDQGW